MSKWICVDDICIPSDENDWEELVAFADAIAEQEPIDIVRCRECKRSEASLNDGCVYCTQLMWTMNPDDFCSYGCRDSEKPNNCEHITEDGVTCAKYPACDDCPDNPLNKVKGSERLVKGSDEPQQKSCATCKHALGNWDGKSNNCGRCCGADRRFYEPKDEPQTERNMP